MCLMTVFDVFDMFDMFDVFDVFDVFSVYHDVLRWLIDVIIDGTDMLTCFDVF